MKWVVMIMLLTIQAIGYADEMVDFVRKRANDSMNVIQNLDNNKDGLNVIYPQYNDSPPVSGYYQGSEQKSTNLKEDAAEAANHDEWANQVKEVSNNKDESKKTDGAWIEDAAHRGRVISSQATGGIGSIDPNLVDCTKPTYCKTDYIEKLCTFRPKEVLNYCEKRLEIDRIARIEETHFSVGVHINTNRHNYAGLIVNLATGGIDWENSGPRDASFIVNGVLPFVPCDSISGRIVNVRSSRGSYVNNIGYPNCGSHILTLEAHANGKVWIDVDFDFTVSRTVFDYQDRWESDCQSFEQFLHCDKKQESCVIENETHDVYGVLMHRPCWKYQLGFLCKNIDQNQSNCDQLVKEGCRWISSICESTDGVSSNCKQYREKYTCPITTCMDTSTICNPQKYCLDGHCDPQGRTKDTDFNEVASTLSAIFEAGSGYRDGVAIFSGEVKKCTQYALNAVNCCSDSGWLHDTSSLFQCGDEAIELGKAKEEGRAIYIDHRETTANLSDTKAYCIFKTKLARIIQSEGRFKQLGLGFGNFKNPDCRGMLPGELQALNFDRIDFHDYIADLKGKTKDLNPDELNKRIQEQMQKKSNEGRNKKS